VIRITMAEEDTAQKMTPATRYYRLHRDEQLARKKEEYNNSPEVIAKREQRERKKAEKEAQIEAEREAERELKRIEKERILQEKIALAKATKRQFKEKSGDGLGGFLAASLPASGENS
jgi:hypothetical protein